MHLSDLPKGREASFLFAFSANILSFGEKTAEASPKETVFLGERRGKSEGALKPAGGRLKGQGDERNLRFSASVESTTRFLR